MNERAIFAAGCFWGIQHFFDQLDGVEKTRVGYIGGHTENPSYNEVCRDNTGHAEAVEILFDPTTINYTQLLQQFWACHDPTLVNRQGPDIGSQYRSAIFYTDATQLTQAEKSRDQAQAEYSRVIATQIQPASHFYPAEDYHQAYFKKHPNAACSLSIQHPEQN